MRKKDQRIRIHPMGLSELASIYNVHRHTMRKWIKKISDKVGKREGKLYSVAQLTIIFEKLGFPYYINLEDTFAKRNKPDK